MIFTRLIKELNYRKCAIPTKITNELLCMNDENIRRYDIMCIVKKCVSDSGKTKDSQEYATSTSDSVK